VPPSFIYKGGNRYEIRDWTDTLELVDMNIVPDETGKPLVFDDEDEANTYAWSQLNGETRTVGVD
jgi:hypothetical protein